MSIAEKLKTIAENQRKVYDAGKAAGGIALRNLIVENHGGTGCFLMYTTVENGKVVAKVDHDGRDDNYPGTIYGGGEYQVLAGSLVVLGVYDDWGYLNDESYLEEIYREMIGELWVYGFMVTAEDGEDCVLDF